MVFVALMLGAAPARAAWLTAGFVPLPEDRFTTALLESGDVLVCGAGTKELRACAVWGVATGRFRRAGREEAFRLDAGTVVLRDGAVLVAGGLDGAGEALASAELRPPSGQGPPRALAPLPIPLAPTAARAVTLGEAGGAELALVVGSVRGRPAAYLWRGERHPWREIEPPDDLFVRGMLPFPGGQLLAVGRRRRDDGLRLYRWDLVAAAWSTLPSQPCRDSSPELLAWDDRHALLVCYTDGAYGTISVLDLDGAVMRTVDLPWLKEQPAQLQPLSGGRLLITTNHQAWLWSGGAGPIPEIEPPLADPWTGSSVKLKDDRVLVVGGLTRARGFVQLFDPAGRPVGAPCTGEEAFLRDFPWPPPDEPERDFADRTLWEWAPMFARMVTPACRRALAAGRAPALLGFVYDQARAPAGSVAAGWGRLGVCGLRLPAMTTHMRAWLASETNVAVRALCLAALAELGDSASVGRFLDGAVAPRARPHRWRVDPALTLALPASPALRALAPPVLARAAAHRAHGHDELRRTLCDPPPWQRAAPRPDLCARVDGPREVVWAEGQPRGGGAQLVMEARADRALGPGPMTVTGGLELRAFLQERAALLLAGRLGLSSRGRAAGELMVLPIGVGFFVGRWAAVGAALGGGMSGVGGEVPLALRGLVELFAAYDAGERWKLAAWVRPGWTPDSARRRGGVRALPFVDEVSAGVRLGWWSSGGLGRAPWLLRDGFVGLAYSEQMRIPSVALLLGRSTTAASDRTCLDY
jgi:hypothetical protein